MGLDEAISVSFVNPIRDDATGWAFREGDGHGLDEVVGFASSQSAYEVGFNKLPASLEMLEARLSAGGPYLFGERIVETDYRLFCTLVRFDSVYFGHFKCNEKQIQDYPHLQAYLERIYRLPGVAQTVNFDHIKRHYYYTHDDINPTRLVPVGPHLGWV